jgi:hypothetical protein
VRECASRPKEHARRLDGEVAIPKGAGRKHKRWIAGRDCDQRGLDEVGLHDDAASVLLLLLFRGRVQDRADRLVAAG